VGHRLKAREARVDLQDLVEWPGYGVDDEGGVWSFRKCGGGILTTKRKLIPWVKPSGHHCVSLRRAGKTFKRMVHQLVLETFVGPCPDGMEARHGDSNPANNRLGNLEWNTRTINTVDRHYCSSPITTGRWRLLPEQASEIYRRRTAGEPLAVLADEFHVTQATVSHIALGKTWSHLRP
jgi:hypothetical protein